MDFLIDELKEQKVKLSWGKKEKNQNRWKQKSENSSPGRGLRISPRPEDGVPVNSTWKQRHIITVSYIMSAGLWATRSEDGDRTTPGPSQTAPRSFPAPMFL